MAMRELTSKTFDREILLSPNWVLVDFFATWCGPCKAIAPYLENLATTYSMVDFFKVDIDANPDLAQRFKISSVPTFKFIHKGRVQKTQVGLLNPSDLDSQLRSLLKL
jgi:thioredoxin 1